MGVTKFSGNTGYRGVVKIQKDEERSGGTANLTTVLATSGNFTMGHNPIFSSGVWGAGYMNASERVAYANDIARLEGSVGLEYTAGEVFKAVRAMCFTYRGNKYGTFLQVFPNGIHGFEGFAWATSLSFSAAQGQIVSGDFNWTSYLDGGPSKGGRNQIIVDDDESDSEVNTPYGAIATGVTPPGGIIPPFDYNGLYPYWGTDVVGKKEDGTWDNKVIPDIISWNANYDSAIEVLKCCGCKNGTYYDEVTGSSAPLAPDYLGLGPMNASCSMEIFKLKNDFSDDSLHAQHGFRIYLHTPADGAYTPMGTGTNSYIIELPYVVCNSKASQVQQGTSWITGSFQYEAIGDFKNPPLNLITNTSSNP